MSLAGGAYFARDLLLPVMLGLLLALTLSPVSRGLARVGIPHSLSAAVLVFTTSAIVIAIVAASAGTVAMWSDEIPRMGIEIRQKLSSMTEAVEEVRNATEQVEQMGNNEEPTERVVIEQPGLLDTAFDTVTRVGAMFIVTMVLALFLLSSGELFYGKLVQAFDRMSDKKRALATVYNIERRVSRYLLTITLINAGLGICVGTSLACLGLPNALVWGVAAFLFNFLPYVGGMFGSALVAAFAIVHFDQLGYALLAPLGYLILTSIEGQIVNPLIVGRRLAMNTVAVFLTVVLWGWLWGIPGALVAVPFLVIFKVICENVDSLNTMGTFLSAEDPPREMPKTAPVVSPGEGG
ncbi:MAG: AI-2E family transporter [Sulfitobacter sp.]|nr:AI-2E family transporter [Sulfitobacter sp.]